MTHGHSAVDVAERGLSIDLVDYATGRDLHPTRAIYAAVHDGLSLHVRGHGHEPPQRQVAPAFLERLAAQAPHRIYLTRD